VVFVDPDAALKASLVIQSAQQLELDGDPRRYFHVRIASRTGVERVRLELGSSGGRTAIPTAQLASRQPCAGGTCVAITLGPGFPEEPSRMILSVPEIGHEVEAPITRIAAGAYQLDAEALAGNTAIEIALDDPIRRLFPSPEIDPATGTGVILFPRTLEARVGPGGCAGPFPANDPGWGPLAADRAMLAAPFFGDGVPLVCVSLRPADPPEGPAVEEQTVLPRAVTHPFQHVYTPPVEIAPLVYLPLFDLEISSSARCTEAEGLIDSAVMDSALAIGGDILRIDPLRIAESSGVPCRQDPERRLDAPSLAARIDAALDMALPGRRVRVLLVYANNLALPLPSGLVGDIAALEASFSPMSSPDRQIALFAIAPSGPSMQLSPDLQIAFGATEETAFKDAIAGALSGLWPFKTLLHTDQTVVPLSAGAAAPFLLYKVCDANGQVHPLGVSSGEAFVPPALGPAYTVSLPAQVLVPSMTFVVPSVQVNWEGCSALCDRPAPGAMEGQPWRIDSSC
jgi:hypothetical protein